jgi:hypothetical protein
MVPSQINRGAKFSPCKKYRLQLWRLWDDQLPIIMFLMLNPSSADAHNDDPTIRRCVNFTKNWGYGGFYIGNLYPLISSKPKLLLESLSVSHSENKLNLDEMAEKCDKIICAWGNFEIVKKLGIPNDFLIDYKNKLYYISKSKNETPKHPLYLKSSLKLKKYNKLNINNINSL